MKNHLLTLGILLLGGVAAQPALADSFFLVGTNDTTGAPCSVSAPCAEVTVTTSSNTATFTVSSLDNHYVFDTFGFNFTGAGTLSLTSASGEVSSPSLSGPGSFNQDGWGSFDYIFNTGKNGGSNSADCVVTAGSPGPGCTFTFTVTDSLPGSLTASEFESLSSGGTGSGFFAGHIATSNASGFVGDAGPGGSVVPEPSSLMLLWTGALALAGVVRRRFGR
jgi:hypothetical protein